MPKLAEMKEWIDRRKVSLAGLVGLAVSGLAYAASAIDINLTPISEIITEVVALVPDLIDLVVGIVPIIIVIAIVGFIVALFDRILGMMKI